MSWKVSQWILPWDEDAHDAHRKYPHIRRRYAAKRRKLSKGKKLDAIRKSIIWQITSYMKASAKY